MHENNYHYSFQIRQLSTDARQKCPVAPWLIFSESSQSKIMPKAYDKTEKIFAHMITRSSIFDGKDVNDHAA